MVCVELAHERQPWCLGIVEREIYTVEKDSTSWMGELKIGDRVIDIRKLEPTPPGADIFNKTDRTFPVFIEDIRMS